MILSNPKERSRINKKLSQICISDDAAEGGTIEFVVMLVQTTFQLFISADMIHLYIVQLTLDGSNDDCDTLNSNGVDCFIQECEVNLSLCDDIVRQFKPISI